MNDCVFCQIIEGDAPATLVYEDRDVLGFFPLPDGRLADGHVLVVPRRHSADLFDTGESELAAVMVAIRRVSDGLRAALGATGVNVLNASGPNSDQSVFHLHFHVVPRWGDDGLNTWPRGKSAHIVSSDSAALLRRHLSDRFRRGTIPEPT
jgi:histidine triad (HIT) family protein